MFGTFDTLLLCEAADCRGVKWRGYVFNTFMIHHKSGCISHPQSIRFDSDCVCFLLLLLSRRPRCLLCLHYQRSSKAIRRNLRDNFPDVAEKEIQTSEKKMKRGWFYAPDVLLKYLLIRRSAFASSRFVVLSMIFRPSETARWRSLGFIAMPLAGNGNYASRLISL